MIELVLKKPVIVHKETLHVLEIREPTYNEIEALGFLFSVSPDSGVKVDSQVTLKYIPLLTGIPRSSVTQVTKLDTFKVGIVVIRFFTGLETEETSGNDSAMSHGSGSQTPLNFAGRLFPTLLIWGQRPSV